MWFEQKEEVVQETFSVCFCIPLILFANLQKIECSKTIRFLKRLHAVLPWLRCSVFGSRAKNY
jgi:hypothetical protein